jgi:predicted NACHT family NTPase
MHKSKHVEVLPALSGNFTTQVKQLATEAKDLSKSYADLTERMLKFAERFRELWNHAHTLDGKKANGQHAAHFLKVLGQVVDTQNRSIWSRWVTIGKHAPKLLHYKSALPPYRDSLYELALATKEGKPLDGWIHDKKLSTESTIRDVQSLCKKRTRTSRPRTHLAAVTLNFDDYDTAAKTLEEVIVKDVDFTVHSQEAFRQAMKERLGPKYAKIARRFT